MVQDPRRSLALLVETLDGRLRRAAQDSAELLDPATLRRFRRGLDEAAQVLSSRSPAVAALDRVRSLCSEAMVLDRLLAAGCAVEHEIATPTGRRVDFRARRDGATLAIHVKRAPAETLSEQRGAIPRAWRELEQVERGLVASLALEPSHRARPPVEALEAAREFVAQASVGEQLLLRGSRGRPLGRLRIVGPSTAAHATIVAESSRSFDDDVPRFQATLRKAFAQFMPRCENLIVVCGAPGGLDAFAVALLGSQIERWDRRPKVGELIAYGRGGDGFWAGPMRNQSRIAAYWPLVSDAGPLLFVREGQGSTRGAALARAVFA